MVRDQVERVQHRIEALDALEHRARHLERRELVLAVRVEQLDRAEGAEISHAALKW